MLEVFIRREDAERFIDVRGDDPELASTLQVEWREPSRCAVSTRSRRFAVLVSADLVVATAKRTNMAQEQGSQLRIQFLDARFSGGVPSRERDREHDQPVYSYQDADPKRDVDPHARHSLPATADGRSRRPERRGTIGPGAMPIRLRGQPVVTVENVSGWRGSSR